MKNKEKSQEKPKENMHPRDKFKEPKPESLKEVPKYVTTVASNFFRRMAYIIKLVYDTNHWTLFLLALFSLLQGVIPVVQAYVGAQILNVLAEAFTDQVSGYDFYMKKIMGLLLAQFACIVLRQVINALNNIVTRIAGETVANHVNVKIMEKAKELDLSSYDRPEFYEKMENASREAGHQPIHILRSVFSCISSIISMVSFVVILWGVNHFAPFMIIAVSVPQALVSMHYRKRNFLYLRWHSKERRQLDYYRNLLTNKDMAKELRIFHLSDFLIERYEKIFRGYFKKLKDIFYKEGASNLGMSILSALVNCYLFFYIAARVVKGTLKVGDYSLYASAMNSISGGIGTVINCISDIYEGTLFIDNMLIFMAEKKEIVPVIGENKQPLLPERHIGHKIEFEHVYFKYPKQSEYVLSDINVTLNAGENVVLVGLNGAGKTTFIKLLIRLYDPTEGRILLDGVDIREYDVNALYELYGIIFQDFGKYAVSVRENIEFGNIDAENDEGRVVESAKFGNASDFIDRLPDKFETPLMRYFEENGIELSTGQWQKLSIARAFYSNADILILDEPTAALDAIAEQEIYTRFGELSENRTTVFVSHRLSSATTADKIIVLEYGRVVEMGTHKELMAAQGQYYELFSTQAERYIADAEGTLPERKHVEIHRREEISGRI